MNIIPMPTPDAREANRLRNARWREKNRERKNEQSNRYYAKRRAERLAAKAAEPAPTTKRCACCEEEKLFDAFGVNRQRKDGHHSYCKDCSSEKRIAWNNQNRETKRGYGRRFYVANAETIYAKQAARLKMARLENPAAVRAKAREIKRLARLKDVDKAREYDRRHRAKFAESARATVRRWMKANRHIKNAHEMVRRARKRGAFVEMVDPLVVFTRDNGACGICKRAVEPEDKWHIDHVLPLSKGGEHSYANTQLAHAVCNIAKGSKLVAA